MDILASFLGLLLLSPLLLLLALLVKLQDGGPVLYRANRVGRNGDPFRLLKYRSMRVDADRVGPGITTQGDSRITRIGRFLRRTKFDELPQLWNVLKGDMSLVGPRPEDPRYIVLYTADQRQILSVQPGITSLASLTYRHEEQVLTGPDWESLYISKVMPEKLKLDLEYLGRRTVFTDLLLILKTAVAVFR